MKNFAIIVLLLIMVGMTAFGYFTYDKVMKESKEMETKIATLENEIAENKNKNPFDDYSKNYLNKMKNMNYESEEMADNIYVYSPKEDESSVSHITIDRNSIAHIYFANGTPLATQYPNGYEVKDVINAFFTKER